MAWREEGGMRDAEGYEGDTLYHMRPLGAQNLEKLPAEVLVARSVALRVVKGKHRKGGKRCGRATRAESVLLRAVERFCARRADSMYVEPPSRAGGSTQAQSYPHAATRRRAMMPMPQARLRTRHVGGAPTTTH